MNPTSSPIIFESVTVLRENSVVLDNLSMSFPEGKTTLVMGPSGSGKSTLLKVAAGLIPPDRGSVLILGKDPQKGWEKDIIEMRRRCGFLFQDGALWQNLSVYQNIALPVEFHHPELNSREIRQRVEASLKKFSMEHLLPYRPARLSGGEKKLVAFARSLILHPLILFLDEPTASVDARSRATVHETIRDLKARERTIVAVTHDADLASMIADYFLVIKNGSILEFDETSQVIRSTNPEVAEILTDVLSETATYDDDILDLLEPGTGTEPDTGEFPEDLFQ
jgi:ABC-type transporter Mla maintaining outer membrane lipid asymmetry ATPase subunit MlaF